MTHSHTMGKEGMVPAILASTAMFVVAYFVYTPPPAGDMGICFPSPNRWELNSLAGWLINLLLAAATTIVLYFTNKEFTLVRGSDTVLQGMFLISAASCPWLSGMLTSSWIIALANLICFTVLFGCYRKRNATQELFLIATILSLGSMIQYAFIFFMPVYIIGAGFMKCLNIKVVLAFVLGVCSPYWVGVGLGIIPISSFSMPALSNLFDNFTPDDNLFFCLLNISITVTIGLLLALNNMVKLYAGNTQRRLNNSFVNLIGLCCVACIILDSGNMPAYFASTYMICAVQLANLFALRNIKYGWIWLLALSIMYITMFSLQVLNL
ncbi:MAG: hypothetical protein NC204_02255 [Candidatus Amulumruptor caecigallinarius]|nr:hypothetical protein [Candidatus Amulumruptor caecigallinarius]